MERFRVVMMACVLAALSISGCHRGPVIAPVRGVVTHDGKAVDQGNVQFFPVTGGPMAAGNLTSTGEFRLTTKSAFDGAIVGEYIVVVVPPTGTTLLDATLMPGQPSPLRYDNIPDLARSQLTSPLTAVVEKGSNEFEFDLSVLGKNKG